MPSTPTRDGTREPSMDGPASHHPKPSTERSRLMDSFHSNYSCSASSSSTDDSNYDYTKPIFTLTQDAGGDLLNPLQIVATTDIAFDRSLQTPSLKDHGDVPKDRGVCLPCGAAVADAAKMPNSTPFLGMELPRPHSRTNLNMNIAACLKTVLPKAIFSDRDTRKLVIDRITALPTTHAVFYSVHDNEDCCQVIYHPNGNSASSSSIGGLAIHSAAFAKRPPSGLAINVQSASSASAGAPTGAPAGASAAASAAVSARVDAPQMSLVKQSKNAFRTVSTRDLPTALENSWYFRFTPEGSFRVHIDFSLEKLKIRTCTYKIPGFCVNPNLVEDSSFAFSSTNVHSVPVSYFVLGNETSDPVLVITDFYQSPLSVVPLLNHLASHHCNKHVFCIDLSPVTRYGFDEAIVFLAEFVVNICIRTGVTRSVAELSESAGDSHRSGYDSPTGFKAVRHNPLPVRSNLQDVVSQISFVGQGSGANLALYLSILLMILTDGADSIKEYSYSDSPIGRFLQRVLKTLTITKLITIKSIVLINPIMMSFPACVRARSRACSLFVCNKAHATVGVSLKKLHLINRQFKKSARETFMTYVPDDLQLYFQNVVDTNYTKLIYRSMYLLSHISKDNIKVAFITDEAANRSTDIISVYNSLSKRHKLRLPISIFLSGDCDSILMSLDDLEELKLLARDSDSVYLRSIPAAGHDCLVTCKDIVGKFV